MNGEDEFLAFAADCRSADLKIKKALFGIADAVKFSSLGLMLAKVCCRFDDPGGALEEAIANMRDFVSKYEDSLKEGSALDGEVYRLAADTTQRSKDG